jgi:predicted amidohydrolase YtcJ
MAFAQNHAELIVHNTRVTTLDEQRPEATAVAVKDGLFLAVGGKDDVIKHRGPGTRLLARERFTLVSRWAKRRAAA